MNNNLNTSDNLYNIDIQLSDKCKVCGHSGVHADAMINSPAMSAKLYHIHCPHCNSQYYSSDISSSHTTDSSNQKMFTEPHTCLCCPKCLSTNISISTDIVMTSMPVKHPAVCNSCRHHFIVSDEEYKYAAQEQLDVKDILDNMPIYSMHFDDKPSSHLLGWECPKCHSVMSPFQPYCMKCAGQIPSTNFNSGDLT